MESLFEQKVQGHHVKTLFSKVLDMVFFKSLVCKFRKSKCRNNVKLQL